MKIVKHYFSSSKRRYGIPWVAVVDKATGMPNLNTWVGGYTGHRGEGGDLYVTDPEDGAVYMYGQLDHQGRKTEQGYVLYSGGDFIAVPNSLLRIALAGKLQTTYIAIRTEAEGDRFVTIKSVTAHNLPEAIAASSESSGFAADLLLTRDDLRKLNCPFLQERVQRVTGKDIDHRTALGLYDMIRKNQDAIRAAMDAQDRTTAAQNAEESETISKAAEDSVSVPNGYRVWYVVSTVRRSADRFSSLEAAMKQLESASQNPEIVKVELTQKYTKADAQGEEIEITEEEYLEASQAS